MEASSILNITETIDLLSNKSSQPKSNEEFIFGIVNCTIYLLCSIFSTFLNLSLILNWIIYCKKDKYADCLLISIAISDFLCGFLLCPIFFIKELIKINLISSNVISRNLTFVTDSIRYTIWWISPVSLLLLSFHRFKQIISPFKEGVKLNRFRVITLVSIWLIVPTISFPIIWYENSIKPEELKTFFIDYICDLILFISVFILNILIIVQFKSKLKKTRLNKNNFKNEKKAILCTLTLAMLLFITWVTYLILEPFAIYKYEFVEYFHGIYFSFGYFWIISNPLIVLLFNKNLRIDLKFIYNKFNPISQTSNT